MKIALAIQNADPARGGAERYTIDLAASLVHRGHEVHLLAATFARNVEPARQVRIEGAAGTRLGRYLRYLDSLDKHLAQTSYDVVHAMLPVYHCDIYHPHSGIAADSLATGHLKRTTPITQTLSRLANQLNRKRRKTAAIEKKLLTSPNPPIVLYLSDYVKQAALKHYPQLPEDHLARLFNGTDLKKFDPQSRPDAGPKIRRLFKIPPTATVALIIAQDYQRKGLRQAIHATAQTNADQPYRPLYLLVVGKQKTDSYRRLAQRLNVADRVIFAGSTTDPYAFYQAADFFVLPTRHDPCSLVVLEALAMGLPVVSTRFNGACEIMTQSHHGFILDDPSDIDALTTTFQALLTPSLRADMHTQCLSLRPQLSQEHHVDTLLEIYSRL